MELRAGQTVTVHQVINVLGHGAAPTVSKARQPALERFPHSNLSPGWHATQYPGGEQRL